MTTERIYAEITLGDASVGDVPIATLHGDGAPVTEKELETQGSLETELEGRAHHPLVFILMSIAIQSAGTDLDIRNHGSLRLNEVVAQQKRTSNESVTRSLKNPPTENLDEKFEIPAETTIALRRVQHPSCPECADCIIDMGLMIEGEEGASEHLKLEGSFGKRIESNFRYFLCNLHDLTAVRGSVTDEEQTKSNSRNRESFVHG